MTGKQDIIMSNVSLLERIVAYPDQRLPEFDTAIYACASPALLPSNFFKLFTSSWALDDVAKIQLTISYESRTGRIEPPRLGFSHGEYSTLFLVYSVPIRRHLDHQMALNDMHPPFYFEDDVLNENGRLEVSDRDYGWRCMGKPHWFADALPHSVRHPWFKVVPYRLDGIDKDGMPKDGVVLAPEGQPLSLLWMHGEMDRFGNRPGDMVIHESAVQFNASREKRYSTPSP
jgi:hypothetical protein